MSRTQESGAYLGGIGAMLEVADVCPSCGTKHGEAQFSLHHGDGRDCPTVVMGSFPIVTPLEEAESPARAPAGQRIHDFEVVVSPSATLGVPPLPRGRASDPSRGLAVPWLSPPDLGEVL